MRYHFQDQFRAEIHASKRTRQALWAANKDKVLRDQMERAMEKSRQIEAQIKRRG